MALLDFLFEGSPPPQSTSFASTSANLPDWFSAYAQAMLNKSTAIASEPYQGFTGPRVASLGADQTDSFAGVRAAQGVATPALTQAQNLYGTAGGTSSLTPAQPYINAAAESFPTAASRYMSPYMTQVTDRIAELGNRNLTERILPQVQDQFVASGQLGSSRNAEFGSRAIRDTANEIAGQQAGALQQGYQLAGQQFGADASRQQALGQLTGQLTSDTAGRQLTAGQGLGALGGLQQGAALKDAAALEAIGGTQQQQQQRNLDTAYQQFLEERNYPRENIALLNQALRGVNPPASTTGQETSPNQFMGASPLAQIAGAGLTAATLGKVFKSAAGGHVKVPRGALGRMHYGR